MCAQQDAREASSELWNAFEMMAPAAAAKTSRTAFGKDVAAKYEKAKDVKVNGKTSKWFIGVRLLPKPYLNPKTQGYKFQFEWEDRFVVGKVPDGLMSPSERKRKRKRKERLKRDTRFKAAA